MPESDATPEPAIDDPMLLADPLHIVEELRTEPRTLRLDDVVAAFQSGSTLVLEVAEYEDQAAYEARSGSHAIGAAGAVAWAERLHATWRAQRQELVDAEQREAAEVRSDPRLSDLGRTDALDGLGKRYAESRSKQLGSLEAVVDEALAAREAACRVLAAGSTAADDRSPELRALDRVAEGLRLAAFVQATAGLDARQFADAVASRIKAGDAATPDLLELATHRLAANPEHARALAIQARGAQRERVMAAIKADPKRSAAVGELALLRRLRDRIVNERKFYAADPFGQMPKLTSSRD